MFACAALAPASAHAQDTGGGVTILTKESLQRFAVGPGGSLQAVSKRASQASREGINLSDCQADLRINFPLTLAGFQSTDVVEVWATNTSADCSTATLRPGIPPQCYKIPVNVALTQTTNFYANVKDLIRGVGDATTLDASGCALTERATIKVFVLLLRNSTTVAGQDNATFTVDTIGPKPLAGVRVLPGDTRLGVRWDSTGTAGEGGTAGLADILGVTAYCDPEPIAAAANPSDAGTTVVCSDAATGTTGDADPDADPDADATSAVGAEPQCTTVPASGGNATSPGGIPLPQGLPSEGVACSPLSFAPKDGKAIVPDPTFAQKYECARFDSAGATSLTIDKVGGAPLVNGKVYAVSVAARDTFENVGELASALCQYPEPTNDFWRDYRNAGGEAGGGFCTVESAGLPMGSFSLFAVGLVFGFSTLRRIRKESKKGANALRGSGRLRSDVRDDS